MLKIFLYSTAIVMIMTPYVERANAQEVCISATNSDVYPESYEICQDLPTPYPMSLPRTL